MVTLIDAAVAAIDIAMSSTDGTPGRGQEISVTNTR